MTPPSGTETDHSLGMFGLAAVQSEHLFRAIFEQAAVGIALIETATGRFLRINQRYCDIVGLSRDDMTATTFMAITHPDDLQADLGNMEDLKAGRIHNFRMVKRYVRSDGSIVWVDLTVAPLWAVGEQPTFHIAVVQDITERKRAEQNLADLNATLEEQVAQRTHELHESRRHLKAIVDGTSDAVYVKDIEGRYLLFNHAAGQFVGKGEEEVIGHDDRFIFSPADAEGVMEADRKVITGGVTMTYEDVATTADGVVRTFLSTKGPLLDGHGRVTGIFGISRDITKRKQAEEALRASEERWQLAVLGTTDGIWDWDIQKHTVFLSLRWKELRGYRDDEIGVDESEWSSRIHPEDYSRVMATIESYLKKDIPSYQCEYRTRHKDGTYLWINDRGIAIWDEQGQAARMVGSETDITERKWAEKALRESEERFRRIFEHAGTGIAITDMNGRFLRCNPAYCALLGYSEEELRELTFSKLVHPDDLTHNMAEIQRLISEELASFEIENRSCRKDGREVWVHKFVSVLLSETGRPVNLFVLVTDVTDRRRMQGLLEQRVEERTKALQASEAFNKEVLDSLSAHVAVLDASGVIVAVNRVWEKAAIRNDPSRMARVSLGANYLTVCERAADASVEARQTLEGIVDVLAGRKNVFETEYLCARPGQQQWFSMRVTPLSDRGGCVIAHEDVTDRKRSEEALRVSYQRLQTLSREVQVAKERERSRLSRELHDEFGQVLSGLKFDLIGIATASAKKRLASADAIRTKVMRALGMVDRLFVSLREMVSALRPALLEELGLVPALEGLVTDIQERSGLRCRIVVDPASFRICCGIEVERTIYRIVQELLNNVSRHAKATMATITLSCSGGMARLIVRDNGCGFRVDEVPSKGRFGLQGIRERVELLGGTVDIRSKPGQTTVTVCILVKAPSGRKGTAVRSRLPISATARKTRRHGHAK